MTSGIEQPVRTAPAVAALDVLAAATARRVRDLGVALAAFWVIVIAVAGGSAIALLGWPAESARYFSWDLGAPPTAATIGGLYLASVATFGAALVRSRSEVRSLSVGVLALALPTLWFTWAHHPVFDWSRPQAVAWVILFLSAPIAIARDLCTAAGPDRSPPAGRKTRATLILASIAGAVGALALWVEPLATQVAARSPIPIVGLTGRYLGAWCAFIATTAGTAAFRGRATDARLVAILLGTVSIGLLTAAARTTDELGPNATAYVIAASAVGIVAVVLHRTNLETNAPAVDGEEPSKTATSTPTADERIRS